VSSGLDGDTLDAVIRIGNDLGLKMGGKLAKPVRVADLQQVVAQRAVTRGEPTTAELGQAIKADQLFIEYQPILDCKLSRMNAVEALVRWHHRCSAWCCPRASSRSPRRAASSTR
jgi:predicted signal transduction protein with EAL and GGDEF domain